MIRPLHSALIVISSILLMSGSCEEKADNAALKSLFTKYEQGEIQQCTFEGKKVFSAGLNAPDAGTEIYDGHGKQIGKCYYSSGQVDAMCEKLADCEVIYRCENHINGQPPVDKYDLKQ
jgi:hypothetical protein